MEPQQCGAGSATAPLQSAREESTSPRPSSLPRQTPAPWRMSQRVACKMREAGFGSEGDQEEQAHRRPLSSTPGAHAVSPESQPRPNRQPWRMSQRKVRAMREAGLGGGSGASDAEGAGEPAVVRQSPSLSGAPLPISPMAASPTVASTQPTSFATEADMGPHLSSKFAREAYADVARSMKPEASRTGVVDVDTEPHSSDREELMQQQQTRSLWRASQKLARKMQEAGYGIRRGADRTDRLPSPPPSSQMTEQQRPWRLSQRIARKMREAGFGGETEQEPHAGDSSLPSQSSIPEHQQHPESTIRPNVAEAEADVSTLSSDPHRDDEIDNFGEGAQMTQDTLYEDAVDNSNRSDQDHPMFTDSTHSHATSVGVIGFPFAERYGDIDIDIDVPSFINVPSAHLVEEEESLVMAEANVWEEEKFRVTIFGQHFNVCCIAAFFVAIVGAAIALAVVRLDGGDDTVISQVLTLSPTVTTEPSALPSSLPTKSPAPSFVPSLVPSTRPTTMPSNCPSTSPTSDTYAKVMQILLHHHVSDVNDLQTNDEFSPQKRALEWIAYIDADSVAYASDEYFEDDEFQELLVERFVLAVLYYSTTSPSLWISFDGSWNQKYGFLGSGHVCCWSELDSKSNDFVGVSSCDDNGRVTGLSLANNNLTGSIPHELSYLAKLETIDLRKNALVGPIPPSLGTLTDLRDLHLEGNDLTGTLDGVLWPSSSLSPPARSGGSSFIGSFPNVRCLVLSDNGLTGALSERIGDLTQLVSLQLDNNDLTTVPESIGNLTLLEELNFQNNKLKGSVPSSLGKLDRLRYLYLNGNDLSGSIPSSLGNLGNLIELNLQDNRLNGTVPGEFSNLTSLTHFLVDHNDLTGHLNFICTNQSKIVYSSADCDIPSPEISCDCCTTCTIVNEDCGPDQIILGIKLVTDMYGFETSWTIANKSRGETLALGKGYSSASTFSHQKCVDYPGTYEFTVSDASGDGMCCTAGRGNYTFTITDRTGHTLFFSGGEFYDWEKITFTLAANSKIDKFILENDGTCPCDTDGCPDCASQSPPCPYDWPPW